MTATWPQHAQQLGRMLRYARMRYLAGLMMEFVTGPVVSLAAATLVLCLAIALCATGAGSRSGLPYYLVRLAGALALALPAVVTYRLAHRVPSLYRMAQILDVRAGLEDASSTAWFLLQNAGYASNPAATAQVTYATNSVAEARVGSLFPLSARRGAGAASMAALLVLTGVLNLPGAGGAYAKLFAGGARLVLPGRVQSPGDAPGARAEADAAVQPGAATKGTAGVTTEAAAGAGGHRGQVSQQGEQPADAPGAGLGGDGSQKAPDLAGDAGGAGDRERASPRAAGSAPGAAMVQQKEGAQAGTPAPGPSLRSVVSQLFSPLQNLLSANGLQPAKTGAAMAPSGPAAPAAPAANTKAAPEGNQTASPAAAGQQAGLPGDGEQDSSAAMPREHAAGGKRAGTPGSYVTQVVAEAPGSRNRLPISSTAESIRANLQGERGHTAVPALRGAAGLPANQSFNFEHREDANQPAAHNDVPFASRASIQAYLEAPREQPTARKAGGGHF